MRLDCIFCLKTEGVNPEMRSTYEYEIIRIQGKALQWIGHPLR